MDRAGQARDIELSEDMKVQRRWWHFQTFMLIVLLAFLLSAAVASRQYQFQRTESGELALRYKWIGYFQKPTQLEISYLQTNDNSGPLTLYFDRNFFKYYTINKIIPEPASQGFRSDSVGFAFALSDSEAGSIYFEIEPIRFGVSKFNIISESEKITASQWIFP